MDKSKILNLLGPFIRGEVPKDQRWYDKLREVSDLILQDEVEPSIGILKKLFHDPLDPKSTPDREISGAHGVFSLLLLRRGHKGVEKE